MTSPYREHRVRTSLARHVGTSATTEDELRALVRKARLAGVIVFLKTELDRLPEISRRLIETEHQRLCEGR